MNNLNQPDQTQLTVTAMPLTRSVSMTTFEEELVLRFQQEEHLRSFSAAWSRILVDWCRITGRLPQPTADN